MSETLGLTPGTLVITNNPALWPDCNDCPGVVIGTFSDDTMISLVLYTGQAIICSCIECMAVDEEKFCEAIRELEEDPKEVLEWMAERHLYPYD